MSKPLKFRNQRYSAGVMAQRDFIQYEVRYSYWFNGEKAEAPYFVSVWDMKKHDNVSTEMTRRFNTQDEAIAFCQDIYEGRVSVESLKTEVQAILDAETARYAAMIDGEVLSFRNVLSEQGVSLKAFLTCLNAWDQRRDDAKAALSFDSICRQANGNQLKAKVPVNGNESENGSEKRETGTRPTGAKGEPSGFERFWAAYPRRVGKQDALKAWGQLNPDDALVDQIVAGVERWKTCEQWTKDDGKFICYPATFLRGRRWEEDDRPDVPPSPGRPSGPKNYAGDEDFLGRG